MPTITQTGRNKLKLNRLTKTQFENIQNIKNDELYLVDPEFTGGKVLGTDVNGDIVETNINTTNIVTDVQVNSASVVTSGVANIPIVGSDVAGVVVGDGGIRGINFLNSGNPYIVRAIDTEVTAKTSAFKPLTPANIDLAVKTGVTTNTLTLTDAEKLAANTWTGSLQNVKVNGTALTKDANNAVDVPMPTSVKQIAKAGTGIQFDDRVAVDGTIVGSDVTISTAGVASGFSTSSYVSVDSPMKKYVTDVSSTISSFEMGAKVRVSSESGQKFGYFMAQQYAAGSNLSNFCYLRLSATVAYGGLSGVSVSGSSTTFSTDTDYWLKLSWTAGNKVEVYSSTDGTTYTKQGESSSALASISSAMINSLTTVFAVGAAVTNAAVPISPFYKGSIDLPQAYMKINGVEVWRGAEYATCVDTTISLSGASAPTSATEGFVGQFYVDTTNGTGYMCVSASGGTYTWKQITA